MKPSPIRLSIFAALVFLASMTKAEIYSLPLFVTATASDVSTGVVRILNGTDESGTVAIYAIDDAGTRSGPATFTLNASAAVEFSASDLMAGNATEGLIGSIGNVSGDVRLEIDTDLQIVPAAYARAADGTLSATHDTVQGRAATGGGYEYLVPVFNLSTQMTQASRLRLINPGVAAASVTIEGRDDYGTAGMDTVELTLGAGTATTLTAQQLEAGDTDPTGSLGAGVDKWRLTVSSDRRLQVVNVVSSTSGYVNNLSTTALSGLAPVDHEAFNERFVDSGIEYRTDSGDLTFTAEAGDRFTETGEADGIAVSFTGSYKYEAIGQDLGLAMLSYDIGRECEANLYFGFPTSGWLASFCTVADHPDGYWVAGNWSVVGGSADDSAVSYVVEAVLPGVPTSGFFAPSTLSNGGSETFTGGGTTIMLNDGAYFELDDGTRYTCTSSDGCAITNGTVTQGTVIGTPARDDEIDTFPTFRTATPPGNLSFTAGTPIDRLTMPEASNGNGTLIYSLSPVVPGLLFDSATRRLSGTPAEAGAHTMTYTVRDEDGDTDTLAFTIKVTDNDPIDTAAGNILEHLVALTAGLPARPFVNTTIGGTGDTVGTLRLGLNPRVFPVIIMESEHREGVLVAGSSLGDGRVVAFSGTDFLSLEEPGLLGNASVDRLLANAVRWTASDGTAPLRVVADNQGIADALAAEGLDGVDVVGRGPGGWVRDWSTSALRDADVAVVVVNHRWGPRLVADSVASLREFTERGGGLIVAGSALHWRWNIEQDQGPFTGNLLLRGTGISWTEDSINEIVTATTTTTADLSLRPAYVLDEYIGGGSLDAIQMALLPGVMHDALELGRTGDLDQALARLVRETPALPVSSALPEARLAAEVAETLGPHEWPEIHPWAAVFPGLPARDAPRVDGTVTVDASRSEFPADATRRERHLPLGFYAPPGALVTIEIPASHATGDLRVSVGELHDDLGKGYTAQPMWRRAPWLRREFAVTDRRTHATNAYGGSIALVVPADYERGRVQVTVRGAIPMAVYTDGESSAAEWFADLDAGAPQAIIQTMGSIRLVISTESARGVDDPGEVAAFWDGFNRHHAELSGEPVPRAFESVWIFGPQVGWGYANAGPVRINYPLHGEVWALAPGTAEGRTWLATLPNLGPTPHRVPPQTGYSPAAHGVDWWLFGHELGHQWQSEDWTGHGITEVGVNLFTMYTLNFYLFSGNDYNVYTEQQTHGCAAPLDHAVLANERWSTGGDCEKLALYRQLIAQFGWGAMKTVFHSYYDPAYPRSTYGGSLDGFAIRFSAIVQRDLVGFFQHWEYPLSESAAATIDGFGYEPWLPPGW